MVQQASNQNYRDSDGLNEFQLVHALITQSLNKCHQESVDENDNAITIKESNSQNNIISDVFQTFNTTQKKRVFPRYVKHFLSQFRRSKEYISNPNSEVLIETPSNRSTVARHASLHSLPPSGENGRKELRRSLSSNVHKKVLHFESCANLNTDQVCDRVPPITPPPQRSPGVEKCAGGIYYPPASPSSPTKMEEDSEPQNLTPEPPRQPQVLTGRNLKRVPSERFQKMRRKVQKLM
uniref:Uncharacterized protein n=1 Tax=Ciona savignyi TaxID=51511 RepID=H2ZE73_CIOSA